MTNNPVDDTTLMSEKDYQRVFRRMYANGYFTNHGPLAREFEQELESFLDIGHAVTVGNESLALLIAMTALELRGEIILPAWGSELPARIANWLGLQIRYSDIDRSTHQLSIESLQPKLNNEAEAVCLVEMYGSRCDPSLIDYLCAQQKQVIILAIDSFAAASSTGLVENRSGVTTVFGFGPGKILYSTQGGAIATSDDGLAERCRNIRSSYGARKSVPVMATCNGRFSEFQAGVGLASLEYVPQAIERNHAIAAIYDAAMTDHAVATPLRFANTSLQNGQCYPIFFRGDQRDGLSSELQGMGVELLAGKPSHDDHPIARDLAASVAFLPVNNAAADGLAEKIARHFNNLP
ncbi:DegT/DnrJ/EryC1/StrS family aminotransferase [Stieleria marina]